MNIYPIQNKEKIARFLHLNPELYLYALGDMDDSFWPYTKWYALEEKEELLALTFLYTGGKRATLLGFSDDVESMKELLSSLVPLLPLHFHAHLSLGLSNVFEQKYHREDFGEYTRMILRHPAKVLSQNCQEVCPLSEADLEDIENLYKESYPENWFDPSMLKSKKYFGVRKKGKLVTIAGIHFCSERYEVAALGNVTTHPQWRGEGLGMLVSAKVCQSLLGYVKTIGLNVKTHNFSAIQCYHKLGFEKVFDFNEFVFYRKP